MEATLSISFTHTTIIRNELVLAGPTAQTITGATNGGRKLSCAICYKFALTMPKFCFKLLNAGTKLRSHMFKFAIIRGLVHDQKNSQIILLLYLVNANHGSRSRYHKANR